MTSMNFLTRGTEQYSQRSQEFLQTQVSILLEKLMISIGQN
jgi:hypothetical protein